MTSPTGRESDKFMLRFPDGMRDRIKARARICRRSMNAEIIKLLEVAMEKENAPEGESSEALDQ